MADTIRVYERIADVPAEAWDALHTDDDSPFVEHAWLRALEETGCATAERGWQPLHLTRWRDGQLVSAAPAYVKSHSEGEFVFDWQWANVAARFGLEYYPKLVLAVPFTPATGSRLLRAPGEDLGETAAVFAEAARALAKQAGLSSVHVLFPHEREAAALAEGAGFARRYGVQFHWRNEGYRSADEFLARFQSKRRHALKRERAQPARDGVTVRTLRGAELTAAHVAPMFRFYASTVDKFMWGRRYLNERFFHRVVETFSHRLAWALAFDRAGEPLAGAFNLERGARFYGRYWGAERELPFLHFNVCFYQGIDECIARGHAVFEPGAGGEHKLARGFEPALTHSAHWLADARLDRTLRGFLERERAALTEAVDRERASGPLRRKAAGAGAGAACDEPSAASGLGATNDEGGEGGAR